MTDAYVDAGYRYASRHDAGNRAWMLAQKPHIAEACKGAQQAALDRLSITAERVQRERAKIAFFDPRSLFNSDGTPRKIEELDADTAAALSALDVSVSGDGSVVLKYRLSDKNKALDALDKILGLYAPEKKEITGKDGGAIDMRVSSLPDDVLEKYALGEAALDADGTSDCA